MFNIGDLVTLQVPQECDWDIDPGCNNEIAYCAKIQLVYKIIESEVSQYSRVSPYMYKDISIRNIKKLWHDKCWESNEFKLHLWHHFNIEFPQLYEDARERDEDICHVLYAIFSEWYANESWLIPYCAPESSDICSLGSIIAALSV